MEETATQKMAGALEVEKVEALKKDASLAVARAEEIAKISCAEHEALAANFLVEIKKRLSVAEENRTFIVKPLNDQVKRINSRFKEGMEPLERAYEIVSGGLKAWRNSAEVREAKEKADAIARDAHAALREGDLETAQGKISEHKDAVALAPKAVRTEGGKVTFRKVWRHEIVDVEKLPASYWMVDEKKVAAAVKAGIAIPGVKAWQEETEVVSA